MSIIDTLITDRTPADAALVRSLNATGWAAMTDEQRALYLSEGLKGAYKASDLNRVNAAMDYLVGRLKSRGINVELKRSKIPHKASGGGSRLPEGFTELAYIESTGTQYIDTGFKPNQDTRLVMDFQLTDTAIRHLFGARTTSTTGLFFAACMSATTIRVDYRTEQKTFTVGSVLNRMTLDFNKNIVTLGGVSQSYTKSTFTPDLEMPLFTSNSGGSITGDTYKAKMKVYSCQIYDNGTLVRDYIPCKNASGVAGLYDLANGVFYQNAGAGTFAVGNIIEREPSAELDDFTWYDSDIPTPALLTEHMANVSVIRGSLRAVLPEIPADMNDGLTIEEANNIEVVLVTIEQFITNMLATYRHCGVTVSGMGGLFF